jgi:DNA-binding MarR family transcriptional regulator
VCGDLIRDGLVKSTDNPDHQTSPLLRLTTAGSETLAELVRRSDIERTRVLDHTDVTVAEMESAQAVIRTLISALEAQ